MKRALHSAQGQPHVRLFTESEAAEHCRYFDRGCTNPVRAFQQWARRQGVPVKYAGRTRLYDPRVLDAFLERDSWTRRHRPVSSRRREALALVAPAVARPSSAASPTVNPVSADSVSRRRSWREDASISTVRPDKEVVTGGGR